MRPEESFVGQPVRSLQTMLRVISEYDGSIPTVVPDGIYGRETRNAVSVFQSNNALPSTGITDQRTWEMISDKYDDAIVYIGKAEPIEIVLDPNVIFVLGDSSPYLYLAQGMLRFLSTIHDNISAPSNSGSVDLETARSIRSFQQVSKLEPTGDLDRKTWKHLSKQFTLNANRKGIA